MNPMLTKKNYTTQAMKMKVFMLAHRLWDYVENSHPKSVIKERTDMVVLAIAKVYQRRCYSLALKSMAKEAWYAVRPCFKELASQASTIQIMKVGFESLSMKENKQIDDFCMRLKCLVTNIRALGEEVTESNMVKKLLQSDKVSSNHIYTRTSWRPRLDDCRRSGRI